jgi:benzoyl-CoA reductase/2-hydroxyglutaryl-CoA dehydratase subunit BcrC/BadD/HgdB
VRVFVYPGEKLPPPPPGQAAAAVKKVEAAVQLARKEAARLAGIKGKKDEAEEKLEEGRGGRVLPGGFPVLYGQLRVLGWIVLCWEPWAGCVLCT